MFINFQFGWYILGYKRNQVGVYKIISINISVGEISLYIIYGQKQDYGVEVLILFIKKSFMIIGKVVLFF